MKNASRYALLFALAVAFAPAAASAAEAAKPVVSGFVDGGWFHESNRVTGGASQAFIVRDAAVYLQKDFGMAGVFVDIPFGSSLSTGGAITTQNFALNLAYKGQAYAHMKYENGVYWQLGRFDKIFGVEANDTKDIRFTSQGLLYSLFVPRTHTGLLVGTKLGTLDLKAYAAHTNGILSSDGTAGAGNDFGFGVVSGVNTVERVRNYDFGAQASMDAGDLLARVGYRLHKDVAAAALEGLLDVVAGFKASALTVQAGVDVGNYAESNRETSLGLLGIVDYALADSLSAGARVEYVNKALGVDGAKLFAVTAGPAYRYTDNVSFKADYTFGSTKTTAAADSVKDHVVAADLVVAF